MIADSNPSPTDMVRAIAGGDKRMETLFCAHYYPSVFKILMGFTRDRFRAEDLTHDVLLTVLVRLRAEGIDKPARLTNFVHQTARFSFIGWYRQSGRIEFRESMEDRPDTNSTEELALREEQSQLVVQVMDEMPVERDRDVLFRSYLCDESKRSICDALALTTAHYDRVVSRARKRLGQLISQKETGVRTALEYQL